MTEVPHLSVSVTAEIDGCVARGISSDGLPPKWFTKDPKTSFEDDDLPQMLRSIRNAADAGMQIATQKSFFLWWRQLYEMQTSWANSTGLATLLAGLGTSLLERAVLDSLCRHLDSPLHEVLHQNRIGVSFSALRPELGELQPRDVLPDSPRRRVKLRHTIGLGDVLLTNSKNGSVDHPRDGLPFSLEENISAYQLDHFKIKMSGDQEFDELRLTQIAKIVTETAGTKSRFTLDGNENYQTISDFRTTWAKLNQNSVLQRFIDNSLLFVEQPIHRSSALDDSVRRELANWTEAPPIIIDESDADLDCLPKALELGYAGTSHKNCKGIIKGLLAQATIYYQEQLGNDCILSAEDLGNVGPVALLQDLAMVAAIGIKHVERNGHHYFAGLSMYDPPLQDQVLTNHNDLYCKRDDGMIALCPTGGAISLDSINGAPFGVLPLIDLQQFCPWDF